MNLNSFSRRAVLIGLTSAGLPGCMPPKYKARCRLTVTAEVDGRTVTASSVREQVTSDQPSWLPTSGGVGSRIHGEGVILLLGGNRVLVAGLRGFHDGRPTTDPWPFISKLGGRSNGADNWSNGQNPAYDDIASRRSLGLIDIPASRQPMFIEFPDRRQSAGVIHDPEALANIGTNGIRVLKATIELTRDRIFTGKPDETFPWLRDSLKAARAGSILSDGSWDYRASDILLER